ncbi:hypothetical protein [Hymenobacter rubidus]|uniref:hypothetical protein n=1 Tax=Hymenobacter rubidus TaxID=1441626 RepID=UPI00191E9577|nr:hypothetical protein [Hymenobacter rubidus]
MAIDYPEPHRREALIGTLVIHGVLLLLFIFMVFKGPNPPLAALGGGDGVELNYGLDPAGSGDIQSMAPANNSQNREDSRPPKASPDPQPRPTAEASPPDPTPPAQEKIVTSEAEESPVSEAPVEKPAPVAKEEVKVAPKPKRQVAVAFSPKGSATGGGNGVNGTSNTPTGNNNGDHPGTTGDQGDPNGSLDAKALYGAAGRGGSGASPGSGGLEMAGWAFENKPTVVAVDNINFAGKMRYKIKIDDNGTVIGVTKVSGNMSQEQDNLCRKALERATFRPTTNTPGGATGFYTFNFAAN